MCRHGKAIPFFVRDEVQSFFRIDSSENHLSREKTISSFLAVFEERMQTTEKRAFLFPDEAPPFYLLPDTCNNGLLI